MPSRTDWTMRLVYRMSDPGRLDEAIDYFEREWQLNGRSYRWDAGQALESRPVMLAAARAYRDLLANGQRVEPDYRSAAIEWIGDQPPDNYPGEWEQMIQSVIEQTVKPLVDAAIGDKLLIDPPTEEE